MTYGENKIILVLGGITHDNRGDLAMMEGLFSKLRQLSSNIVPILYSWNPERSRATFNVECRLSPDLDISPQFSTKSNRAPSAATIISTHCL